MRLKDEPTDIYALSNCWGLSHWLVCIVSINELILEDKVAQKLTYVDDFDGSVIEDGGTVTFSVDGSSYEIDLSAKNKEKLTKALSPFIDVARKSSSRSSAASGASSSSAKKSDPKELQKIRDWANSHGHDVSSRGRIPASVIEAYQAAN